MTTNQKLGAGVGAAVLAAGITAAVLLSGGPTSVPVGGDVQAAINAAQCGDTLVLQAGAVYSANLTLNKQCGTNPITIQSSRVSELPEGQRVSPAQASLMARLQSVVNAEPVVKTTAGASGYRFVGVEIATDTATRPVYDLVRWGESRQAQTTLAQVPRNLQIDRSYIHGWPTQDVQRGVSMNCADCAVTNSYISDIHGIGYDTQAVAGWNGSLNIQVVNNHLEAAGENVLFGGADPASAELMPANITIQRNYLFKPLTWQVGHPTYAGKHWTVKNLLEIKAGRNITIDGNVLQNNWVDGQSGVGVLFTVRNQECTAPWSTIQSVTFTNNTVTNSTGGALNLLGKDNEAEAAFGKCTNSATQGSVRGSGLTISNNLFHSNGGAFLTLNGFYGVTLSRNTHLQSGNLMTLYGEPSQQFAYTANLTQDHDYGIFGDGGLIGTVALNQWTPGWIFNGNVVGKPYGSYPPNNQYPPSVTLPPDYRSPYPNTGCDIDALNAAQAGGGASAPSPTVTVTPQPSPTVTVTPTPAPLPSPTPTPQPSPCPMTAWPSSVAGQNQKMEQQRALGCYPVRRPNSGQGMEYARP